MNFGSAISNLCFDKNYQNPSTPSLSEVLELMTTEKRIDLSASWRKIVSKNIFRLESESIKNHLSSNKFFKQLPCTVKLYSYFQIDSMQTGYRKFSYIWWQTGIYVQNHFAFDFFRCLIFRNFLFCSVKRLRKERSRERERVLGEFLIFAFTKFFIWTTSFDFIIANVPSSPCKGQKSLVVILHNIKYLYDSWKKVYSKFRIDCLWIHSHYIDSTNSQILSSTYFPTPSPAHSSLLLKTTKITITHIFRRINWLGKTRKSVCSPPSLQFLFTFGKHTFIENLFYKKTHKITNVIKTFCSGKTALQSTQIKAGGSTVEEWYKFLIFDFSSRPAVRRQARCRWIHIRANTIRHIATSNWLHIYVRIQIVYMHMYGVVELLVQRRRTLLDWYFATFPFMQFWRWIHGSSVANMGEGYWRQEGVPFDLSLFYELFMKVTLKARNFGDMLFYF